MLRDQVDTVMPESILSELEGIRRLTQYPKDADLEGYPSLYGICSAHLDIIRLKIDIVLKRLRREAA